MELCEMDFPQFRKYKNDFSYFKIDSIEQFTEWKRTGNKWEKSFFVARILPDRNYISDMLVDYELYWDKISKEEFEEFKKSVQ